MGRIRVVAALLGGVLALAALVVLSVVVLQSQERARREVISNFADRGELAAQQLSGSTQVSSSRQAADAQVRLSGEPTEAALNAWEGEADAGIPYTALFDGRGRHLAVHPSEAKPASDELGQRGLRLATKGRISTSGIVSSPYGDVIESFIPFPAEDGLRVLVIGQPLDVVAQFAAGGLEDAAGVAGGAAYVVDRAGNIVTAVGSESRARAAAVSRAVREERNAGRIGRDRLVTRAVANTGLVVALTAPEEELTADLPSPVPPRLALIGFGLALLFAVALAARAVGDARRIHAAREAAEDASRLATEANLAKSEFLARMSHELRTPLNAILGFGQLLELEELSPDQRDSVEQVVKGGRRLLALINEVLDISRIESGTQQLSLEPVHVGGVIADAVALIRPLAEERDIRLRANVPPEVEDLHVMADKQRLGQVLLNLLSNGIKYNVEHGMVSVVATREDADRVRIGVTDTGPGIPEDRIARLFTPFERLGAEQTDVEGTGLGLALSKTLIQAMGGIVEVDTMMGEGTTFWVALPETESLESETHEVAVERVAPTNGGGRIVYIEDNLANLRLMEKLVAKRMDVDLIPAMTGALGIDLARQHVPDLILLDLHLPDLRGDEILVRLGKDPTTRSIPVVILSADATAGEIKRMRALGAADYLTKPLDIAALQSVIGRFLRSGYEGRASASEE